MRERTILAPANAGTMFNLWELAGRHRSLVGGEDAGRIVFAEGENDHKQTMQRDDCGAVFVLHRFLDWRVPRSLSSPDISGSAYGDAQA